MPKILNYPNASFEKSLDIAKATFELGGSCNEETCAEKLGKKVSGGFRTIIASAQKFGLIEYGRGEIEVTPDYKLIEHAYNQEERNNALTKAFFKPDVFDELFKRFEGKELPVGLLERMLIREYEVNPKRASRVAKYFIDGLEFLGLIDSSNNLKSLNIDNNSSPVEDIANADDSNEVTENYDEDLIHSSKSSNGQTKVGSINLGEGKFLIHFIGPGMNSTIAINDEDDLMIVEATLNKIKKKIKELEGDI